MRLMAYSGVCMLGFGTITSSAELRSSSVRSHSRFSLKRYVAHSTGSWAITRVVRSLRSSSPIRRSTARVIDSTLRMLPMPTQRGQTIWLDSPRDGLSRWRDISNSPNRDSLPI